MSRHAPAGLFLLLSATTALLAAAPALAFTGHDPCDFTKKAYRHAILRGNQQVIATLSGAYLSCVLDEPEVRNTETGKAFRALLKSRDAVAAQVRFETYGGRVTPHPVVLEAAQVLMRHFLDSSRMARHVFVSSFVRDRAQQEALLRHPMLKRFASKRSLHLAGAAADLAFLGRRKGMRAIAREADKVLKRHMGARASLIKIHREPHCLHIALHHQRARFLLEQRFRELHVAGVLRTYTPGKLPDNAHYRMP